MKSLFKPEIYHKTVIESSVAGIFVVDDSGRFEFGNDSFFNISGWLREELIGQCFMKVFPEDLKDFMLLRWQEIQTGIEKPYETRIITKSGEIKNLFVSHSQTIIDGKRKYVVVTRDITEKIKVEQKLKEYHDKLERSYEKLLEEDNVKTEFISNITHELLTPLTSIRGFVELLDDGTMGKINKEQKKSLEIILRNSDRLIRLIKELLDTSNLENNKLGLQYGLVSLNNILSKTTQDIHPQANDKQITIIKKIQQLPEIWGDEERLVQVITNLLINAIKFTPNNGKITVKAKACKEQVKISISDTGIGIPADKLDSIFDKFYQVDGSAIRKYGGLGIGLSICKSIIDKHYGKIWAQSDGNGSTFYIVLPRLRYKNGERND